MFDSVINYLDKFAPELLVIQFGFLVILFTLFLWLWFANRRKYHNLKHAIPANVVKSYLDSIIQNSTALKSSLFRGGGLDVNSIPSVMSLQNLSGGDSLAVSGAPSTALMEELNQKKAQIAALESQLGTAQNAQRDLEAKNQQSHVSLSSAEGKIKELEALINQLRSGSGGDAGLKAELTMITNERDELRDRLKEFEIIADDLANLKRLQQENEQLKRSLAAQSGAQVPTPAPAKKEEPTPVVAEVSDLLEDLGQSQTADADVNALEEFLSAATADAEEIPVEAPAPEVKEEIVEVAAAKLAENKSGSEKTPEDLLSEFEKMLG